MAFVVCLSWSLPLSLSANFSQILQIGYPLSPIRLVAHFNFVKIQRKRKDKASKPKRNENCNDKRTGNSSWSRSLEQTSQPRMQWIKNCNRYILTCGALNYSRWQLVLLFFYLLSFSLPGIVTVEDKLLYGICLDLNVLPCDCMCADVK